MKWEHDGEEDVIKRFRHLAEGGMEDNLGCIRRMKKANKSQI